MGCIKSLINKIILIAILVAFFFFGGCDFCVIKYQEFANPPREEMIKQSKDFGDFSTISSDYILTRSPNIIGYRKISARYMPTGQKITIIDLKNKDIVKPEDFNSKAIDSKINELLLTFKDSVITLEDLEITGRGTIAAKGKTIPYVTFKANVKNVPFKTVEGLLAAYQSPNVSKAKKNKPAVQTVKVILSARDARRFNQQAAINFIKSIIF